MFGWFRRILFGGCGALVFASRIFRFLRSGIFFVCVAVVSLFFRMYCTMSEIRRLEGSRGVRVAQALVGKSTNLADLVGANAVRLHHPPRCIGAIGGEFPVAVSRGRRIRLRIRVAFNRELVGKFPKFLRQRDQELRSAGFQFGAAAVKKCSAGGFGELDAKPSVVTVISMWFLSFSKSAICCMACCSCSLSFGMLSRVRMKFSPAPSMLEPTFFEVPVGSLKYPPTASCTCLLRIQQPQHDEQRHHRGDEIGVSDFPCAAVMAAVAAFFLEDDDGACLVHSLFAN